MAIGVGNSSVTVEDVLSKVSEADILHHYLGITKIPCVISSPLRPDSKPSFSIYTKDGKKVNWMDFANKESGGTFDLLMKMWHMPFGKVLDKVYNEVECSPVSLVGVVIQERGSVSLPRHIRVQCRVREWRDYDIRYWNSYGITLKWLKHADVYPISHKIIIKNDKRIVLGADRLAYAFIEYKDNQVQMKIYQPYSKTHKWLSGFKDNVISLWTKIPKRGERLIIASSLKDALCLSCQLGIPAISPQGEGYTMSDTAIYQLKERYTRIYISFDTDKAGIENTKRMAELTGFTPVMPDLGQCKDYSDYYRALQDKKEFKKLIRLFE